MLYRIAIKTGNGTFYYLTSNDDLPETDVEVDVDNIQFLSKINSTHAHTFSTRELAKKFCEDLPYPYNEKAIIMEVSSKEDPIAHKIYYRIGKKSLNRINYATNDKKFTLMVTKETAQFSKLEHAQEFFNSLAKFTQKICFIMEVRDFGPPKYEFKNYFLTKTGEKLEQI